MKKFLVFFTLAGIFSFAFKPLVALKVGDALPESKVEMKDVNGKKWSLQSAMQENGLLVMFSCNTCPWVVKNQERTNEILSYALSQKIGVMVLNSNEGSRNADDSYEDMKAYAKSQNYQWPYAVDEKHVLADAFGASRTPECFIFNKQGVLVYHGAIDDNPSDAAAVNRKHLKAAMDENLSGQEVSVKTSRSLGCGIKRIKS